MNPQSSTPCHITSLRRLNRDLWLEALECPETVLETAGHRISLRLLRYCADNAPDIAYEIRHKLCSRRRAVILGYTIEMAGLCFSDDEVKIYVDELVDSMVSHPSIWSANFGHEWDKLWNTIQCFLGIRIGPDGVPPEFRFPECPSEPRYIINPTRYLLPYYHKPNTMLIYDPPHNFEIEAFGAAWCGPELYQIHKAHLVARYESPHDKDGQTVEIFCTPMPARFYTIRVLEGPISTGSIRPAYELGTGSSMANLAAQMGEAIADGMLGLHNS